MDSFSDHDPFPILTLNNPCDHEDAVPTYTATDPFADLDTTNLHLPLNTYPAPLQVPSWNSSSSSSKNHSRWRRRSLFSSRTAASATAPTPDLPDDTVDSLTEDEKRAIHYTQTQIIASFHAAIAARNIPLVTLLVRRGFVSPDVPDHLGRTPLLVAIEAGSGALVCELLALGADIDLFGSIPSSATSPYTTHHHNHNPPSPPSQLRTPLMHAATLGSLALVTLLTSAPHHANDALISPSDGQLALRLAAEHGHREVVSYLPARRGGALLRWRAQHEVAVRRMRAAARKVYRFGEVVLYRVPRFFLWDLPLWVVVKPMWRGGRWLWVNRALVGAWCVRQVRELPGRVGRGARKVWRGVRTVPRGVWRVVKGVPGVVRRLVGWLWKVVKRIPGAMKVVAVCIWDCIKVLGAAAGRVFLRAVSVLHTVVAAVLDFFRNIRPEDVWNGFCAVLEAVFCGLPRALGKAAAYAIALPAGILIALFGLAGKIVVFLVKALWYVAKYVPRQLGEILSAIWASIAKGYEEIRVWINPKHGV